MLSHIIVFARQELTRVHVENAPLLPSYGNKVYVLQLKSTELLLACYSHLYANALHALHVVVNRSTVPWMPRVITRGPSVDGYLATQRNISTNRAVINMLKLTVQQTVVYECAVLYPVREWKNECWRIPDAYRCENRMCS
jgi:hypothetical protein